MLITVAYTSAATKFMTDGELADLLTKARVKNERLEITGLLVYHDGNFLQVVEGPEAKVRQLFHTIENDPRHAHIIKLIDRPVEERQFSDWAMAFRQLSQSSLRDLAGYSAFLDTSWTDEKVKDQASLAYQLLLSFRETLR